MHSFYPNWGHLLGNGWAERIKIGRQLEMSTESLSKGHQNHTRPERTDQQSNVQWQKGTAVRDIPWLQRVWRKKATCAEGARPGQEPQGTMLEPPDQVLTRISYCCHFQDPIPQRYTWNVPFSTWVAQESHHQAFRGHVKSLSASPSTGAEIRNSTWRTPVQGTRTTHQRIKAYYRLMMC